MCTCIILVLVVIVIVIAYPLWWSLHPCTISSSERVWLGLVYLENDFLYSIYIDDDEENNIPIIIIVAVVATTAPVEILVSTFNLPK